MGLAVQRLPEPRGAELGQGVTDANRAAQALDILGRVVAPNSGETIGDVVKAFRHLEELLFDARL